MIFSYPQTRIGERRLASASFRYHWATRQRQLRLQRLAKEEQQTVALALGYHRYVADFGHTDHQQRADFTHPSILPSLAAVVPQLRKESPTQTSAFTYLAKAAATTAAQAAEAAEALVWSEVSTASVEDRLHNWRRRRVSGLKLLEKVFHLAAEAVAPRASPACPWRTMESNSLTAANVRTQRRFKDAAKIISIALQRARWERSSAGQKHRAKALVSAINPDILLQQTIWWGLGRLKRRRWSASRRQLEAVLPQWMIKSEDIFGDVRGDELEILWPENWSLLEPKVGTIAVDKPVCLPKAAQHACGYCNDLTRLLFTDVSLS